MSLRQRGTQAGSLHAPETYCCAIERLSQAPLKEIVLTDSIPILSSKMLPNIRVLSVASLLADAIKRIHYNESVSKLFA